MKWLKRITPKSFLLRYSLQKGAKIVAIFMACCTFISLISFLVELSLYKQCINCTSKVLYNIYGFSIISVIYCCCMFFVHLWFYWGVKNEKASVVLCWVVVTTLWGLQGSSLVFVLLCINITEFSISWILAIICAIFAFLIFVYCILIGYGYWLELKNLTTTEPITS